MSRDSGQPLTEGRPITAEAEQMYPDARPSSGFFIENKPPCTPSKWALLLGFRSSPS